MRFSMLALSLVFILNSSSSTVLAQSWGQLKSAALQAESANKLDEALSFWKKALDSCQDKSGPRYRQSLVGYAHCLSEQGKSAEAEDCYKNFVQCCNVDSLDEDSKAGLIKYAALLRRGGKDTEAAELEKRFNLLATDSDTNSVLKQDSTNPASESSTINAKLWQSTLAEGAKELDSKHYDLAEQKFKASLEISEKLENNKRAMSESLMRLITLFYAQNNFAGAEPYYAKSMELTRKGSGSESTEYAESLRGHAAILRKLNRKQEAMAEEAQADRILSRKQQYSAGGGAENTRHGADPSATRSGSLLHRAGAVRQGFDNPATQMLNE